MNIFFFFFPVEPPYFNLLRGINTDFNTWSGVASVHVCAQLGGKLQLDVGYISIVLLGAHNSCPAYYVGSSPSLH